MPPPPKPSPVDVETGLVLAAARVHAGLDVRGAAAASGIDKSVITRIELGQRSCRVTELDTLAKAYGIGTATVLRAIAGDERARAQLGLDTTSS